MKKWIYVILLYVIGFFLLKDIFNQLSWIESKVLNLYDQFPRMMDYGYIIIFMIPMVLVLVNYFVLRLRTKNPAFTLINALFFPLFVLMLMLNGRFPSGGTFDNVLENVIDGEYWWFLLQYYPTIFGIMAVNITSGIVISEAKSKVTYLTAEAFYLLSGIVLALFSLQLIM